MGCFRLVALLLVAVTLRSSAEVVQQSSAAVNPIRKVVTMLQMMQNKVVAEGKKAEELYDKFMCYCENGEEMLKKSIADAEAKIVELEELLKTGGAQMEQLKADIEQAKEDRAAAKEAIAKAKAMREKEAGEFATESSNLKSYIEALSKAIPAIEKGMAGAFLQSTASTVLRRLSTTMDMNNV